jgi:hypothetical protein
MPSVVELYGERHVLLGSLEPGRRRVSDFLNDVTADVILFEEAWIGDLLHPEAAPVRANPARVRKQDVLLAAPLDRQEAAAMRSGWVRTSTVPVVATLGPCFAVGLLHLPPGVRFDIRRLFGPESRPFVAITDAIMTHSLGRPGGTGFSVLLVRADRILFAGQAADPLRASVPQLRAELQERLRAITGRGRTTSQSG